MIRAARSTDAEAVTDLVERALAHYVVRIGRRPAAMNADYAERIERGEVHVIGEPLAGVMVISHHGDHVYIDVVAVEPGQQGSGIGRELIAFAEQDAVRHGFDELRLHMNERMTENAGFFARLGYQEYDRRTEHGYPRVFLRKRLRG